jgi:hypothetical protein
MFAGLNLAIAETIAARHRVTAPAALHPASTAHAVAAPLKS